MSFTVGDFNGDGAPDVAVLHHSSTSSLFLMFGDGVGGFGPNAEIVVGGDPSAVASGDFDKDGKLDLAVAHYSNGYAISVLQGDGAGHFAAPRKVASFINPDTVSLLVGDVSGDGKQDLVVSKYGTGFAVLLGDDAGNFAAPVGVSGVGEVRRLALGDVNGDGVTDVVAAVGGGGLDWSIAFVPGSKSGSFAVSYRIKLDQEPKAVAIGDFNKDNVPDLAVTVNWFEPRLAVLLGTGSGNFAAPVNYGVGPEPGTVITGDFNYDGNADLVVLSAWVEGAQLLLGNGAGSFTTPAQFVAGGAIVDLAAADLNGDNKPDLVALNRSAPAVSALLADGPASFESVKSYRFDGWAPNSIGVGDFDGDGKPDLAAAFFLSIEFQETGYLVERIYKAAYGDATSPNVVGTVPVVRVRELLADARQIGQNVVVGQGDWQSQLTANKSAFALEFVARPRFAGEFPSSMSADEFVSKLDRNAGGVLSAQEKSSLVATLAQSPADAQRRATVLRAVAENAELRQREFNRAFVLMQYHGYLRRNPDDPQDADFRGWKFWLDKLNEFNGNYV
ncbi:MAG TPA: VCBS repeat-containing protein, partial [Pyrinomonadaceae bacterium]